MDDFIQSVIHGAQVVVYVQGEVDVDTAAVLRERLTDLIQADHTDLVVDLRRVTFMDSTGLGVLVASLGTVRTHGGRLQLVVDGAGVARMLRISGLDQVFVVHTTLDAALSP